MIKKKYTMQEMLEELGRNKSIISRKIIDIVIRNGIIIQEYVKDCVEGTKESKKTYMTLLERLIKKLQIKDLMK